MKSMLTGEKHKKTEEKGITLIALVVTIIVLLILAGVSIMMLTGQNGILRRAQESSVKTAHAEVYETLNLQTADYMTESKLGEYGDSLIQYLLDKEYIKRTDDEGKYIIDVEKLLGQKGKYGNGTDGKTDVYKLEEVSGTGTTKRYKVIYYEKEGSEGVELGNILDGGTETSSKTISSNDFVLIDVDNSSSEEAPERMKGKFAMLLSPENLDHLGISYKDFALSGLGFESLDELKEAANTEQDESKKEAYNGFISLLEGDQLGGLPTGAYKGLICLQALAYGVMYPEETKLKLTAPDGKDYATIENQTESIFSINQAGNYEFNMIMNEKKYQATFKVNQNEVIFSFNNRGLCVYDFNNKKYLEILSGKVTIDGQKINLTPQQDGDGKSTIAIIDKESVPDIDMSSLESVQIELVCENNITIKDDLGELGIFIALCGSY